MSTDVSGQGGKPEELPIQRDALLKAYDTAVAEYRFNVQLTWDRQKSFLTLAVSAITAGVALLKLALDEPVICLFLAAYFALIIRLTRFGAEACKKGKEYTREAQLTMVLAQHELGLYKPLPAFGSSDLHLGLAVTPGQRDHRAAIANRQARRAKDADAGSIGARIADIFNILIFIEALGVFICVGAATIPALDFIAICFQKSALAVWNLVASLGEIGLYSPDN